MLACIFLFYYIIIEGYIYITAIIVLYVVYRIISTQHVKKIEIKGQAVFITGCDTGKSHATAFRLVKSGFTVFAGCLKPEGEGATTLRIKGVDRLHVEPLDVTRDERVNQALETVKASIPETGRVVNVTSVKGRIAWPYDSAYVCSKWAGEAFSDILRREMYRFGVKVVIIEPGHFGYVTQILQGERACYYKLYQIMILRLAEAEFNQRWELAPNEVKEAYGRECIDRLINDLRDDSKGGPKKLDSVTESMLDAVENVNPKCR